MFKKGYIIIVLLLTLMWLSGCGPLFYPPERFMWSKEDNRFNGKKEDMIACGAAADALFPDMNAITSDKDFVANEDIKPYRHFTEKCMLEKGYTFVPGGGRMGYNSCFDSFSAYMAPGCRSIYGGKE